MSDIQLAVEGVEFPDIDRARLEGWLRQVASSHGKELGRVSYLFCDDEYIIRANNEFLGHDYFTDIITFDYSTPTLLSGDIMISLDTVRSNSVLEGEPYERELLRVIAHGVLHLCGINDKLPGEREVMERHEDEALRQWDEL